MVAYFDESGSDEETDVFGLSYFVAPEHVWKHFLTRWFRVMSFLEVCDIHMTKLETSPRPGPYAHVSDPKWKLAKKKIADILTEIPLHGHTVIVHKRDYRLYLAGPKKKRRYYQAREAYIVSMYVLMNKLSDDRALPMAAGEKIACVFDQNEQIAGQAAAIYKAILRGLPQLGTRLGPISFASRCDVPPLQSADVLAYEYRRFMEASWGFKPEKELPIHKALEATGRVNGEFIDREHMAFIQRLPVLKKLLRLPDVDRMLPIERVKS